jgi:hypothetical protein
VNVSPWVSSINLLHVDGKNNPSDVLTKFLPYSKLQPLIQPLLFWKGETMVNDNKPFPVVIRSLSTNTPSGLRGVTNNINPSDVYVIPQPSSYTPVPSIPVISPNNSNEDSEEEFLNIAGKSIFDHGKIDEK